MKIKIRKIKSNDREWTKDVFVRRWSGDFIVSRGKIHRPKELDGFIAEIDNKKKGLITFRAANREIEIVSLDSFLKRKGIGTALLDKVLDFAERKRVKRVWCITTNDNLNALRFYQTKGFNLIKIYPNALKISRKLKPGIPLVGNYGIPIRDEIELEKRHNNLKDFNKKFNR